MSDDLIYRDDAIRAILSEYPEPHYPAWYVGIIEKIGCAEYRPVVYSQWIELSYFYKCSSCCARVQEKTPYCPYCGNDMTISILNSKEREEEMRENTIDG